MSANRRFPATAAAFLLMLSAAGCSSGGDDDEASPAATGDTAAVPGPEATAGPRRPVEGFGEVAFRVQSSAAVRCALLAETARQQAQGLMNRTDLSGYDGMLFVFSSDTTSDFYMKDTPLPLSIAWFDSNGRLVSTTDMEPCLGGGSCPLYGADRPYRYALEVPKGRLPSLGITPGAVITVGGPCT